MFKKIFLGFLLVVALVAGVLAVVVALQPEDFRIERKITIDASPSEVFPHVNHFRKWNTWSPWNKLDPNATLTYGTPEEGVGATFKWSGNDDMGEGGMTILESRPGELVKIKLDFVRPHVSTATTDFIFKAEGNKTVVTWAMHGKNNFMAKGIHLAIDMDKMLGVYFEEGLAKMKTAAEKK